MRRDVLLLEEMIEAAVQAVELVEVSRSRTWLRIGSGATRCFGTSPSSGRPPRSCRLT